LRDQHSGRMTKIDVGVIDFLANVMAATGQTCAVVLSAFRTPETNAVVARTTFGVADSSQHLYGRALDVRFAARLPDAVAVARTMRRGGVGGTRAPASSISTPGQCATGTSITRGCRTC
jgi:uncharacterized protein YcbK (DUF882 family)